MCVKTEIFLKTDFKIIFREIFPFFTSFPLNMIFLVIPKPFCIFSTGKNTVKTKSASYCSRPMTLNESVSYKLTMG